MVSISSTFYSRLFLCKSALQSFSLVTIWLCNFWHKHISAKAAHKMLVKLTNVVYDLFSFNNLSLKLNMNTQIFIELITDKCVLELSAGWTRARSDSARISYQVQTRIPSLTIPATHHPLVNLDNPVLQGVRKLHPVVVVVSDLGGRQVEEEPRLSRWLLRRVLGGRLW